MKLTKIYIPLLGLCMLLGVISCQTEPLSLNGNLTVTNSSAKIKGNKVPVTLNWDECSTTVTQVDLLAGQNILVGNVAVEIVGDNYEITYNITDDGWCLTQTHLSVGDSPGDFPHTNTGNPKVGHFEFGGSLDCASTATYTVPISEGTYIAAHAVVNCKSTSEEFAANIESLPVTIPVCVTAKGDGDSYFDIKIGGESFLAGDYNAWCINLHKSLSNDFCFDANAYSMYDENLPDIFGQPENLGAVNWIVNQDFLTQGYTFGEIQWAIWELLELDNNTSYCCLGTWDEAKALAIFNQAIQHIDFEPGCGELLGIAILPTESFSSTQPVMITIPIPCDIDCEETAWGDGCGFPGKQWATYFQYGN